MKHILEFRELLKGGKADGLTLKGVAKKHKMMVTPEDPLYYSKLIKSGVVDEPEALKIYQKGK